jgi:alkylated DNA repair dioxygenase AlkB
MSQLPLFDTGDLVLTDDARGRVEYLPELIDSVTAAAWFADIRSAVEWKTDRRLMYEREVDVPRLLAHYRLDPPPDATPAPIIEAAGLVTDRLAIPFTSVGLNLYRDGRDSVAPHNDHLNELRKGFPIALLSLGATRRMTIRAKEPPRSTINIDLEPGSLLVMDYDTQLHYTHAIPKTKALVGERISLAFRVKPRLESNDSGVYR